MFPCSCGRQFNSEASLNQHRADKGHTSSAKFTYPGTATRRPPRESWLWNGVKNPAKAIQSILSTGPLPQGTPVSSAPGCELVCSYNWLLNKGAGIHIGGPVPVWQDVPLPVTLPNDVDAYPEGKDFARPPKYSFEPLFRATAEMNPGFRFDGVDIVLNRNSLRKLLDFCAGHKQVSFRVNLLMVRNTLFIERCEGSARFLVGGSRNSGWGRGFERAFTWYPPGVADSAGHHRVLRYPLGNLSCVVRFEVDACYEPTKGEQAQDSTGQTVVDMDQDALASEMGQLSVVEEETKGGKTTERMRQEGLAHQSTAAELKTGTKSKSVGMYLPQLWFGRTPWLIIGQHKEGTFDKIQVIKAADHFGEWESKRQDELQRLVAVLSQLREAVRKDGRSCVAVYEKTSKPPVIAVFALTSDKRALPDDLISEFWGSGDTASSTTPSRSEGSS